MSLTLRQLEGQLIKATPLAYDLAASVAEADGVYFLCPVCWAANGNSNVGTHSCICWFKGRVADDKTPGPGRWNPSGTSIDDLSLVPPGLHSVQLKGGCNAHFHVTNGRIEPA